MATTLAGELLGPKPGRAICSFWQGAVEIALRIIVSLVGSAPALVSAAIALVGISNGDISLVPSETETGSLGSSSYIVGCTTLSIVLEMLLIVVRFCNIGLVNLKVKIFLIIDVIISIILAVGHLVGGVVASHFASQGSESQVRNALATSSAFCLLTVPLYTCLAVWSIFFLGKQWNKKVIKYTLEKAITW